MHGIVREQAERVDLHILFQYFDSSIRPGECRQEN